MPTPAMTEISIDLEGGELPESYPFALWDALLQKFPALQDSPAVGVVPFRLSACEGRLLLSKRTKLVIRLPADLADAAGALCGQALEIGGHRVLLGNLRRRALQHYPTLHAPLVNGPDDEIRFMQEIRDSLDAMGIEAGMICGKRQILKGDGHEISGYGVVVHDLKPEESLRLQHEGMGTAQCYGCGVFVPYKAISGLD